VLLTLAAGQFLMTLGLFAAGRVPDRPQRSAPAADTAMNQH
jgi:hypothetical protein